MPDISILEQRQVSVDDVQKLLDQMQSVEAVASYYDVSSRTITRFIKNKLYRQYCWKKTPPTRTHSSDTHARPADEKE